MEDTVTVRIDPHVHSEGSYDGSEPVELILEQASDIGLDGVVVTDHDDIEQSLRAARLAPEYGLLGIPGVEVSTADGHLLAVGVDEQPTPGKPFLSTVDEIRARGGVAIVPHPFQRSRHGVRKRKLRDCDAVEVYNSMLFTGYRNRRAGSFARRHDYPRVGASDAHSIRNIGRAYTEIHLPESVAANGVESRSVIDALADGATTIRGRRTPIHRSARQYTNGAAKKSLFLTTSRLPVIPTLPASFRQS
ncbi:PHP-associated domain-containing protein [Haloarcula salina]|uniref:PHP domain-containing protein n=1 Tax=Haloarcula salina TaxID=1429914 RepID=A0AA41FYV7_9EURY|nr:PHP domain-containing protein [Haloarcula salina]MBV0901310.1 PHP domain-containing protein [Haloarcula salina]